MKSSYCVVGTLSHLNGFALPLVIEEVRHHPIEEERRIQHMPGVGSTTK
jgi:hypothetical protein